MSDVADENKKLKNDCKTGNLELIIFFRTFKLKLK